jgi:hypothetical protein
MDEATPGITEASRLLLHTFFQQEGTRMENLESLATAFPAGNLPEPLSDFFADLVGCVCHQVVPSVLQKVQQDLQGVSPGTARPVRRWLTSPSTEERDVQALVSGYSPDPSPFRRLWPQPHVSSTDGGPHQQTASGAEAVVETIHGKYLWALTLAYPDAKEKEVQDKQVKVGLAKECLASDKKKLDGAAQEVARLINIYDFPKATYESVISLCSDQDRESSLDAQMAYGAMMDRKRALTDREKALSFAEAELSKLLAPPSEADQQQATFWLEAGRWLKALEKLSVDFYQEEVKAALLNPSRQTAPIP